MKLAGILLLLVFTSGCGGHSGKVVLTGLTGIAAVYKYKVDQKKAEATNAFRDETRTDLEIIKQAIKEQ